MEKKRDRPLVDCATTLGGFPVLGCLPGSAAAASGVKVGDIIVEVNGIPVTGMESYLTARKLDADVMRIKLRRNGELLTLTLQLASSETPAVNASGTFVS